ARLRRAAPDLRVEIICTNVHTDRARTQAEIAVRPAQQLPEELVGESPARLGFAAFRARGSRVDDWLGLSGALSRSLPARWVAANVEPAQIVASADSFPALKEMVAGGLGRTVLPAILAAGDPRLEPDAAYGPTSVPIWVASHADLAQVPRIAEARRILCDALTALAPRLLGAA
ncbi:MAG: LysR substrate-binding domain-containing protein, partial [Albidovulum sp.]